jgi:tetratricopeptide (TPR) repeat protein
MPEELQRINLFGFLNWHTFQRRSEDSLQIQKLQEAYGVHGLDPALAKKIIQIKQILADVPAYAHIVLPDDHPLYRVLAMDSDLYDHKKNVQSYVEVKSLMATAQKSIPAAWSDEHKLKALFKIMAKQHVYENTMLLTEGLIKNPKQWDCDIGALLYLFVAFRNKSWPNLQLVIQPKHLYLRYQSPNQKTGRYFETTNGAVLNEKYNAADQVIALPALYHRVRGDAFLRQKKFNQAVREYQSSLGLESAVLGTYQNLALALAESKQFTAAFKTLAQAKKINPQDLSIKEIIDQVKERQIAASLQRLGYPVEIVDISRSSAVLNVKL